MSKKRLLKNTGFLSILQLFNIVAPLLLLPYLTRVLGVEEFGAVMVALATVMVAFVITDYGFSLSATYRISTNREDKSYINNVISKILTAKIFLTLVAVLILVGVSFLPAFSDYKLIFLSGTLAVVGQAYQPLWLFHGLEKMKNFIIYQVLTKVFYVIFAMLLVNGQGDGAWVLLSWSLSNVIGAVIALYMVKKLGFEVKFSSVKSAIDELKESSQFFWSRVSVAFYTSMSAIIVGTTGLQQAAMYSSAEQGYKAGQAFTSSIAQAMYPYMAKQKNWLVFFQVVFIGGFILFIGSQIVSYFSDFFIIFIFGNEYLESSVILKIMMLTLFVNYLGVLFGYPAMAILDKIKYANKTVNYGVILFISIVLGLYTLDGVTAINIAYSVLATELMVFLLRLSLSIKFIKESKNVI